MTLREMLLDRLEHDIALKGYLASFSGDAAVFWQQAPASQHKGWGSGHQYPRIDYTIDTMGDPARNVSSILVLNIWCDTDMGVEVEPIEQRVRELLDTVFAKPDDSALCCFSWTRSDVFNGMRVDEQEPETYSVTMRFDILEYPVLKIGEPDPMGALARWTKAALPDAFVIGIDEMTGWMVPSADHPVIYWRYVVRQNGRYFFVGMWLDIQISGHIIAPSAGSRGAIADALGIQMPLARFCPMANGSPFHFTLLRAAPGADYLRVGQLALTGRYVVQPPRGGNPLDHIYINGKEVPKYE